METYIKNLVRLGSIACLCLLLCACQDTRKAMQKMKPFEGPLLKTFDLKLDFLDSARRQIYLETPLRLEYESGLQEYPKGVRVIFFDKFGKPQTELTANKAHYHKLDNKYVATGNVIVRNLQKQEQLNTEELTWAPANATIFTDKFVTITSLTEILKGNGLTARQDFTQYKIKYPTGRFTIPK